MATNWLIDRHQSTVYGLRFTVYGQQSTLRSYTVDEQTSSTVEADKIILTILIISKLMTLVVLPANNFFSRKFSLTIAISAYTYSLIHLHLLDFVPILLIRHSAPQAMTTLEFNRDLGNFVPFFFSKIEISSNWSSNIHFDLKQMKNDIWTLQLIKSKHFNAVCHQKAPFSDQFICLDQRPT